MFDWDAFERAGIEAAIGALERGADKIVERAKDKAPVRRLTDQEDRSVKVKLKTIAEIERDAPIRQQLGLAPENPHFFPPTKVVSGRPRVAVARGLTTDVTGLNRRGRYEMRSGRAASEGEVGGRLRREIHRTEAVRDGKVVRLRIVSPTPYAKFQEFGSAHNPAHPYMRPAAHETLPEIKQDIAVSVIRAAKSAARGRLTKVEATMKVMVG